MIKALLVQLPVPQLNFGHKTGNIPFAASCLFQAANNIPDTLIEIFSQLSASCMGDAALLETILTIHPDIIGFSTYMWNVKRVLYLVKELKSHYSPRVVLGGPEVTGDNPLLIDNHLIDLCIQGEGEGIFSRLIKEPELWSMKIKNADTEDFFCNSSSPYLSTPLIPGIEDFMLLETMRGCPHACAYCYYGKSRKLPLYKDDQHVIEGIKWALSHDVKEVYFLDPSMESRPGLASLLKQIANLNKDHHISLISEIRAEAVDDRLADLLAEAGFTWFEIGLQSTNPDALALMNRKSNLDRFKRGVYALKQRSIATEIDLIAGLPGDDPEGFEKTVRFVREIDAINDVQVFPLSILPGTEFRRKAEPLCLTYNMHPPYNILKTPTFSEDEILDAFLYAEQELEMSLYPMPEMDLAWQSAQKKETQDMEDIRVILDGHLLNYKVWLHMSRTLSDLKNTSRRVTHPYQLLIPPEINDPEFVARVLSIFTAINPHTPMEMVFFDPGYIPPVEQLLKSSRIERPHYLDGDQRLLYREEGNRAVIFTVVTPEMKFRFFGPMQRHVCWWRQSFFPDKDTILSLEDQGFDGLLMDTSIPTNFQQEWQDEMAERAGDIIRICFSRFDLNKRWLQKTMSDAYNYNVLP